MAKPRRATSTRSSRTSKPRTATPTLASKSRGRTAPPKAAVVQQLRVAERQVRAVSEPPAPPPRKPAYYEAIAVYESGVRALQKHDFSTAAEQFRTVMQRYPEERELVERSTLYLRVCERETATRPTGPKTPRERIYAATVALNAGDVQAAQSLLRQALSDDPDDDHGHYIMAVALSDAGLNGEAVSSLRQAIALNGENRSLARQDPDLAELRATEAGRLLLNSEVPAARRRIRARR
jgi:tetratricopeptide (TPR) repeat protein